MAVVIEGMRTYFFQRAAAVYFAVAGQIEMIADVTESPVKDMILTASLRRKGLSFRRGTAMNDNPQSPGPRLEAWLSNEQ